MKRENTSSLDEALKDASFYRKYIWQAIQVEAKVQNMSANYCV